MEFVFQFSVNDQQDAQCRSESQRAVAAAATCTSNHVSSRERDSDDAEPQHESAACNSSEATTHLPPTTRHRNQEGVVRGTSWSGLSAVRATRAGVAWGSHGAWLVVARVAANTVLGHEPWMLYCVCLLGRVCLSPWLGPFCPGLSSFGKTQAGGSNTLLPWLMERRRRMTAA